MNSFIENRDLDGFKQDLKRHESVDQNSLYLWMSQAVSADAVDFVRVLLEFGAEPDHVAEGKIWTVLHLAVELERVEIVELLLDAGANVNVPDRTGCTPLHFAVDVEADGAWQMGEKPIPNLSLLLLRRGADPHLPDRSGETPMDVAWGYEYGSFMRLVETKYGSSTRT